MRMKEAPSAALQLQSRTETSEVEMVTVME